MSKLTAEQRLAFVRHDVAVLLEQLPNEILKAPIDGWENVGTMLTNIEVACDLDSDEADQWTRTWWEVWRTDERPRVLAEFDTEQQAKYFVFGYADTNPEAKLQTRQCKWSIARQID